MNKFWFKTQILILQRIILFSQIFLILDESIHQQLDKVYRCINLYYNASSTSIFGYCIFKEFKKVLFCVYKDKQNKQWFEITDEGTTEKLDLITEKRGLAEYFGQEKSLDLQKTQLEKNIQELIWKVNDSKNNSNHLMALEKQIDSQTIKLSQLVTYQDWIDQNNKQ